MQFTVARYVLVGDYKLLLPCRYQRQHKRNVPYQSTKDIIHFNMRDFFGSGFKTEEGVNTTC